ncbi:hypothetical protein [Pseudotabrizicola algicola]|uniref:Uncharacterized protein n=1 Tax=Pseudotabrizicola algicola TaxID=2709381 RepID=A0A6B3RR49_9RHOB|nr:hypothetical protein [Pseudotabrizicola algicola]NEX47626.1 hypothetical protein [Pseudotabrizicola algicola]
MGFHIFGAPDEKLRLKSFGATVKGVKATIRIEIETEDMAALGYALGELGEVQQGQRAKSVRRLALPAPEAR